MTKSESNTKILFKQACDAAWRDRKPRRAIGLLREVIISDPTFVEAHLELARVFFRFIPERLDIADRAVRVYLSSKPDSAHALYWHGTIQSRLGNDEEAEKSFRMAMDLDPFDRQALMGLAFLLFGQARMEQAIPLLEQAVEWYSVQRGYAEGATRLTLAEAYERTGNFAAAIEQWTIVSELREIWPEDEGVNERAREKLIEHCQHPDGER